MTAGMPASTRWLRQLEGCSVALRCVIHESSPGHSSVNTDRPLPMARRSSAVHRWLSEHPAGVPENSSLASQSVIPRSARAMSETISVE